MHRFPVRGWAVLAAALLASGCAPSRDAAPRPANQAYDDNGPDEAAPAPQSRAAKPETEDRFSPLQMLMRYDLNHDGSITRAELEAGLKADFDAADTNHDGKLDENEVRAVNEARWKAQNAATSPLVDWNGDGVVDFREFSGAARSLFVQLDANGDGVLSPEELNPRAKPAKGKAGKPAAKPAKPESGGKAGEGTGAPDR